jgi:hypothetical protein
MSLEMTKSLRGALGELYYKEGCDQKGWAFISLECIHNSSFKDNVLVFKKGFHRISIKIHEQLVSEIKEIAKPTNNSKESPSFVFDFLACRVRQREKYEGVMLANPTELCWVEVKTGKSGLTDNQVDTLGKITIPLALFYIEDVLASPRKIEIEWDIRTGDEWLDELDDRRDQAESDDDYL